MVAEMPSGKVSIPAGRSGVKKAVSELLVGLPVTAGAYSAAVHDGMEPEEFLLAFSRLFAAERQVSVAIRFQAGDLWNALHTLRFKGVRQRFMAAVETKMTPEVAKRYLKRLRQCGWVAGKWVAASRGDKHGWTFYVLNTDGEPVKKSAGDALPYFLGVCRVLRDDGEWIEGEGNGDRRAVMRCASDMPVRDERTKIIDGDPT